MTRLKTTDLSPFRSVVHRVFGIMLHAGTRRSYDLSANPTMSNLVVTAFLKAGLCQWVSVSKIQPT